MCHPKKMPIHMGFPMSRILWEANLKPQTCTEKTKKKKQAMGRLHIPSSKLTWQWKSTFSNREYIFKWWIFHCYVSLLEGICLQIDPINLN